MIQEDVFYLVYRCWTEKGAWKRADRWKTDYERRRSQYRVHPGPVLVDVVHVREIPS